ncbi:MAG: hypothetical protein Q8M70_03035 [bacterium]|nr:hypothetical protein [bacterium]
MKKITLFLLTISLAITLIACQPIEKDYVFQSETDLSSFQAVSASTLLASSLDPISVTAMPLANVQEVQTEDNTVIEDEIDELDKYLWMMETYLGGEGALQVVVVESDLPVYAHMVVFTTKTLAGTSIVYTLYYNETIVEDEVIEDEEENTEEQTPLSVNNNPQPGRFRFVDPEDQNVVSIIDGLLIVGEVQYLLEGKKIVIQDKTIHLLRAYVDEFNHVAVRYMTSEDGDYQFFYTIVVNGQIQSRTSIKVMVQNGKVRTMLQFVEGNARGRYNFSTETIDNITKIHIVYQVMDGTLTERGNIFITATLDEETQVTTYEYVVRPDRQRQNTNTMQPNQNQNEHKYQKDHRHGAQGNRPSNPQQGKF